ncbi:LysR family transcriptional regulator [uncultured Jannaschia sp.]|uniref:LysR family transcriptional regulator n=1 Tax=uncultured Jannaschia sp. TaxID=293347 RepID=UPI002606411C|nr:LysR family transcriptional regulator [uncultured Jannaschia sp.]
MNGTPRDLNDIVAFVEIVRAGGISPAASRTGMPRSTLSRGLKRLEGSLGVTLARRSPKAFSLTDDGRRYFEEVQGAVEQLRASHDKVTSGSRDRTIRVSVPILISHFFLPPALELFRQSFPSTAVRVRVEEDRIDMEAQGIDLVVRAGDPRGDAKVGRELFQSRRRIYAAPDYLERRGTPVAINDISGHDTISCVPLLRIDEAITWTLDGPSGPVSSTIRPVLAINDPEAGCDLTCRGAGLCLLPEFVAWPAVRSGRLTRVLTDWQESAIPVRALLADGRNATEPVRGLMTALAERAPAILGN